ncbi:MAG: hypothetical protein QOJ35_1409 [Solirubrobacteraceae bacterium]|nr:hypothetical protein [Solirubrobacteraceae bacterium]
MPRSSIPGSSCRQPRRLVPGGHIAQHALFLAAFAPPPPRRRPRCQTKRRLIHRAQRSCHHMRADRDTALLLGLRMAVVGSPILSLLLNICSTDSTRAGPGIPLLMQPPQGLLDHLIESQRGGGWSSRPPGRTSAATLLRFWRCSVFATLLMCCPHRICCSWPAAPLAFRRPNSHSGSVDRGQRSRAGSSARWRLRTTP